MPCYDYTAKSDVMTQLKMEKEKKKKNLTIEKRGNFTET
jgi:hypothetical protein